MFTGTVFDIQRCCVHDGPGIRTTVFLKGCSLQCFWCHNPESIAHEKQLMYFTKKCIQCNQCVHICNQKAHTIKNGIHVFDRSLCCGCGACAKSCEAKALIMSGTTMTTEDVMEEILKDRLFYQTSNGGATFSGGEPLLNIDFLEELLIACKQNNIHTVIETAGNVNQDAFKRISPFTDLFLYDVKIMNPEVHKKITGSDNHRCLSNLKYIIQKGKQVKIRVPIIPGINDSDEAIEEIAAFRSTLNKNIEIELLPFHKMGQSKYDSLDMPYQAENQNAPSQEVMQNLRTVLTRYY